jgi:hypothetical protein
MTHIMVKEFTFIKMDKDTKDKTLKAKKMEEEDFII